MNEAETRADLIDPLLAAAGWDVVEAKCCALSAN
jgi:predicted type IV restriction endonuclease